MDDADVADLAAARRIERILAEDQFEAVWARGRAEDLSVTLERVVTDETLRALAPDHGANFAGMCVRPYRHFGAGLPAEPDATRRHSRHPPRGPTSFALLQHRTLKSLDVDLNPPLAGDQLGEVNRKSERIEQLERLFAGDTRGAGCADLLQPLEARFDRVVEVFLFTLHDLDDLRLLFAQPGIGVTHQRHHRWNYLRQGWLTTAE